MRQKILEMSSTFAGKVMVSFQKRSTAGVPVWPPSMMCTGPCVAPLSRLSSSPSLRALKPTWKIAQSGKLPNACDPITRSWRVTYGVGSAFHGERSSPYGLTIALQSRALSITGRYAHRPPVSTRAAFAGDAAPNQSSENTTLCSQRSPSRSASIV